MRDRNGGRRLGKQWPVAAVVLFFPLVGGVVALSGTGSTQAAEVSATARTITGTPAPSTTIREIGLVTLPRDATPDSFQIVSSKGIQAAGVIHSTVGGFRFPDGTLQTTAATTAPITTGPTGSPDAFTAQLQRLHPDIVVVNRSGGGHPTIASALQSISDAGPGKPYLVYVAPGTYREQVRMKPYVVLEGAGKERTTIAAPSGGTGAATIVGAAGATLRNLTVESTGGGDLAVAVRSAAGRLTLDSVRVVAHDGKRTTIAIAKDAGALDLRNVTAEASGGDEAYGVRSQGATALSLAKAVLRATGAARQNVGLSVAGVAGSKLEMTDVELEASGAASFNTGALCEGIHDLFLDGVRARATSAAVINEAFAIGPAAEADTAPARIIGLWATATGGEVARGLSVEARSVVARSSQLVAEGAGNSTGLWIRDGIVTGEQHTIRLLSSTVVADGQTVWSEAPDAAVVIGQSTLEGGPVLADRGVISCAATIDKEWGFHPEGCP